jgi:lipopolysaccharide export system permease protein
MKPFATPPWLLYSYLATEMLAPFFASFLIMNCVFFLVKLIPFLNFVLELQIGLADFLRLFSYLFPNIFLYSIPMAAMMGVTIGFARLSSDSEILALKASGISIYRILPPVVMVTALIALLTSYFSIKLIPISEIYMKQLTYQLLKEKISSGIKEHLFTEALGDVVIYVEQIDKQTEDWTNVWVSDMRGVTNPIVTMASTGRMYGDPATMEVSIVLNDGSLHRPGLESAQIVQFDRYQINIPLRPPSSKATTVKRKTSQTMPELLADAHRFRDDKKQQRDFLIEYHKRLVLPVGCLIISLIGLPLGLQARPGRKAIGIQAGLVIFVLYYIFYTLGKNLAESGALPVSLAMWATNALFFALAVYWLIRVTNERPLLPERLSEVVCQASEQATLKTVRLLQQLRWKILGRKPEKVHAEEEIDRRNPTLIRGNAKSRVFHLPGCEFYDCPNCTIEFKDTQVAVDSGFEPCRFCKDLSSANLEYSAGQTGTQPEVVDKGAQ